MFDIMLDALVDTLKLLPFLFIAFLFIELIEHKLNDKVLSIKKMGPVVGSILGAIPQCGFGSFATNLFSAGIISTGTLISIYLSTSDEMIPILLSENISISSITKIVLVKIVIAIIFGYLINTFYKSNNTNKIDNICKNEHCDCEHSIIKSSIIHTLKISLYIFIITFIISIMFSYIDENLIKKSLIFNSIITPFITCLIGLIPNCASSVLLTRLYVSSIIGFPSLISGLLTNAGISLLVLYKTNKNIKQNIIITILLYFIGVLIGMLFTLLKIQI